MNFIVLLLFSSIYFEVNSQLLRYPRNLQKLQEDKNHVEPYEIQSVKRTILGEKQTKLKPQEIDNTQNTEKLSQKSDENPRQRIKYKRTKNHTIAEPTIHIDTENAIINYEKNDTIATQRHTVEIESMIIKHSNEKTNLLDYLLSDEGNNDNGIGDNMINTRRFMTDTQNLSIPIDDLEPPNDSEIPHDSEKSDADKEPLLNDDKYSTSTLSNLNEKSEEDNCTDTDDIETSEKTDSEDLNENFRKNMPTIGRGITELVNSRMMLFNHPRVCYACNSLRDQSCWSPSRSTSVKYCRRNHKYCLTKVYEIRGQPQVIRDCGESCMSSSTVQTGEAYASCTVCHTDLCNSASGLVILNIVCFTIVAINIIVGVFKPF